MYYLLLFVLKHPVYFNSVPVEVYCEHECKEKYKSFTVIMHPEKNASTRPLGREKNNNVCRGLHEVSASCNSESP